MGGKGCKCGMDLEVGSISFLFSKSFRSTLTEGVGAGGRGRSKEWVLEEEHRSKGGVGDMRRSKDWVMEERCKRKDMCAGG
ncbi:hypothetical protein L6452_43534 [Arctium lappa]|uniref:Uncharacterized protein n=1 Tax=Arctium lappa TaxID=4217 RepID=A0ACB8XDB7_ARCLA|nr:hypothetical protein L6452_43534 [Arctium lappa]